MQISRHSGVCSTADDDKSEHIRIPVADKFEDACQPDCQSAVVFLATMQSWLCSGWLAATHICNLCSLCNSCVDASMASKSWSSKTAMLSFAKADRPDQHHQDELSCALLTIDVKSAASMA